MVALLPVIAAIFASLVTAIVQVFLTRRSKTGTIGTSEAAEVWAAQKDLTTELRNELKRIQDAYREQSDDSEKFRAESTVLRIEMASVREESEITRNSLAAVRKEAGTMRIRMMDLERQLEDCRKWLVQTTEPDPNKEAAI